MLVKKTQEGRYKVLVKLSVTIQQLEKWNADAKSRRLQATLIIMIK